MKKTYVHVKLGEKEFGLFRMGGCGLANCLFFVTRGVILAHRNGWEMLRPTWERFGIGAFFRKEKDKRFYFGLFRGLLSKGTFVKIWTLLTARRIDVERAKNGQVGLVEISGWWNYFVEMPIYWEVVNKYFSRCIHSKAIAKVPQKFINTIALHIRRGDMPDEGRIPLQWSIEALKALIAKIDKDCEVLLFSDGNDEELKPVLDLPFVRRAFFGNALADIVAMSRCQVVVGTNSTFSWFGAWLGQVPCIMPDKNSGCCHVDKTKYCILKDDDFNIPDTFISHIQKTFI